MNLLEDILFIIRSSLLTFVQGEVSKLAITLSVGLVLAIIGWLVSVRYHKLWNNGFQIRQWHHGLCASVAVVTFLFTFIFASMVHVRAITTAVINQWNQSILEGQAWSDEVFVKAYEKIKEAGIEDFRGYPPPNEGGRLIPASTKEGRDLVAKIYAQEIAKHFNDSHPFLSKIIWSSPDEAVQNITHDMMQFFADNQGKKYDLRQSIRMGTENIKRNLEEQIDKMVLLSRVVIVIVFLVLQAIPFGIIGYQAYSELK